MIVIGLIPKIGAMVAAIPLPVLGGAGIVLFAHGGGHRHPDPARVDFHEESNVIILAVSLGFAIAPTVYPTITSGFNEGVRTIISSGITLGAIAAILLNLLFNVWGGNDNVVSRFLPTAQQVETLTIDQVNQMDREQFVREFGALFQNSPWVAEQAYQAQPVRRRL